MILQSKRCTPFCCSIYCFDKSEYELEVVCETSWLGNTCEEISKAAKEFDFNSEVFENITQKTLQEFLNKKLPVIALIDPSVIYGGIQGFGHYVVIIGVENGQIIYHDPGLKKEATATVKQFFEAWSKYFNKGLRIWKFTKK